MKDFFKLKEAITAADKKPENYADPRTGKTKTRMVPTMKMTEQASQVTVGDYTTKHFDICPSAVALYSDIAGKTEMNHLVVETMMLHDIFFRLEKQAIAMGYIDEEELDKAQHYADMIMDNADQMGLLDEHDYIENVHMEKFRDLSEIEMEDEEDDEDEEEDDDEDEMNEKTLTPAELKKREEIAKAIKRENPNMPMAKKMAIATATAKKVAEETVLDESNHPHRVRDELKSQGKHREAGEHAYKHGLGRSYGPHFGMRSSKNSAEMEFHKGYDHAKAREERAARLKNEEVERIDEISADLAHDVYKKRMAQAQSLGKQSGDEPDIKKANVLARAGHKAEKKAGETHLRMIKKILKRPS